MRPAELSPSEPASKERDQTASASKKILHLGPERQLDNYELFLRAIDILRGSLHASQPTGAADAAKLLSSTPIPPQPLGNGRTLGGAAIRAVSRVLFTLTLVAVTGFILLILIGWPADFFGERTGLITEAERARHAIRFEQVTPGHGSQQGRKLVGIGAVESGNQGMSVALSVDGKTAVVGGPGPNNADRDRAPRVGPAGAAWVFARTASGWTQQCRFQQPILALDRDRIRRHLYHFRSAAF